MNQKKQQRNGVLYLDIAIAKKRFQFLTAKIIISAHGYHSVQHLVTHPPPFKDSR